MTDLDAFPEFDPWTQSVALYYQDGSTFIISIDQLDHYRLYGIRLAINYGTQIGASVLLLLVLLLLTRPEKRRSFIFIINALCLISNAVRCILPCCYLTGSMWHPYSQLSGDWSRVTTGDIATTVATNAMTLLVTTLIMISLSIQVWVVCVTTMPLQRYVIMVITTSMACIALGYKATVVIYNIKHILAFETMDQHLRLVSISYVVQAVSIWLFSCVFTYKLGYAIIQRRRLKMPQFGPMQIVFIMGCQTMLVPAIFSSLQFLETVPEFGTQVLTIVCIFLPLSAIWAGVVNDANAGSRPVSPGRLVHREFYQSVVSTTASGSSTVQDKSRGLSVSTYSKGKEIESAMATPSPRKSRVEDNGIHAGHEFGFSHDFATDQV
ncbi:fungal pheromone mating factor STE2 GPCR-domain-containing protein [Pyrenochaeta sp. MPI-SDFR-AT-0127]|nr:fungal pheromone mating factor STE2 GPCR-domain-containing protein [Pyrenochaeta sp. MPI-SDFR-AT-0127]